MTSSSFAFDDFVDAADEIIGDFLHTVLAMLGIIGSNFFFLLEFFQMFDRNTTVIAHRDTIFLGDFLDMLDQFLTPFFGQLRDGNTNDFTVVVRGKPEVGLENRFLDLPMALRSKG